VDPTVKIQIDLVLQNLKKQGKIAQSEIDKIAKSMEDSATRSGSSAKNFGEQVEKQITKKLFGARAMVGKFLGALAGMGIVLAPMALVAKGLQKIQEELQRVTDEMNASLESAEKAKNKLAVSGGPILSAGEIESRSKQATAGTKFKPEQMAEALAIPGALPGTDKQLLDIASAMGMTPAELKKILTSGTTEQLEKQFGVKKAVGQSREQYLADIMRSVGVLALGSAQDVNAMDKLTWDDIIQWTLGNQEAMVAERKARVQKTSEPAINAQREKAKKAIADRNKLVQGQRDALAKTEQAEAGAMEMELAGIGPLGTAKDEETRKRVRVAQTVRAIQARALSATATPEELEQARGISGPAVVAEMRAIRDLIAKQNGMPGVTGKDYSYTGQQIQGDW